MSLPLPRPYRRAHLRRTLALVAVQLLLGHSSLMTTQVYLDTGSASMRTALNFAA